MNKKAILTIVILVLMVLGLGGYLVYDKIYLQFFDEENAKTIINDVTVDVNDLFDTGIIIDKLDRAFGDSNSTYFGYVYEFKKRVAKVSEMDKNQLMYAAVYDDVIASSTEQRMPESLVKSNLNKMFGSYAKYEGNNIVAGTNFILNYDETNKLYTYTISNTKNPYLPTYKAKNTSTKIEEDKILVTRKVFYVEYESTTGDANYNRASIYKSRDKRNKVLTLNLKNGVLSTDEVLAKAGSKLTSYIYTFDKDKDGYILYSIERK